MVTNVEDQFIKDINSNMGILYKICHIYFDDSRNRQDARQEILYQLWKSYPGFKGASKFSTWMYKVALNTAMTYSKKRIRETNENLSQEQWNGIATSNEQQESDEKLRVFYAAINSLSAADKAITLLYLENNSYEEIAAITGLTKTNVSVRLVRIKRTLKTKLQNTI